MRAAINQVLAQANISGSIDQEVWAVWAGNFGRLNRAIGWAQALNTITAAEITSLTTAISNSTLENFFVCAIFDVLPVDLEVETATMPINIAVIWDAAIQAVYPAFTATMRTVITDLMGSIVRDNFQSMVQASFMSDESIVGFGGACLPDYTNGTVKHYNFVAGASNGANFTKVNTTHVSGQGFKQTSLAALMTFERNDFACVGCEVQWYCSAGDRITIRIIDAANDLLLAEISHIQNGSTPDSLYWNSAPGYIAEQGIMIHFDQDDIDSNASQAYLTCVTFEMVGTAPGDGAIGAC